MKQKHTFKRLSVILIIAGFVLTLCSCPAFAGEWELVDTGCPDTETFMNIWSSSDKDIFAVSEQGTIWHYDGILWSKMKMQTNSLNSIWGTSSTNVVVIGDKGTILQYNGSEWKNMVYPVNPDLIDPLMGIWGTSEINIFAVSLFGRIFHYDGFTWRDEEINWVDDLGIASPAALMDIWGTSADNIYVVGSTGTVLHYDGLNWTKVLNGTYDNLTKIWGNGENDIFAVGEKGLVLHYDGAWNPMTIDTTDDLIGIWGNGENDVYVASSTGSVFRYDGSVWSEIITGTFTGLKDICRTVGVEVFAAGSGGNMLNLQNGYYVKPGGSDTNGDGSKAKPFATIQKAIDMASNGHTVLVADGTYTGTGNKELDFNGKAIVVRSENGPESCTIDCQNNGRAFYFHTNEIQSSMVSGFTIINGSSNDHTGAIYCSSSPTITNCDISNNDSMSGIYCLSSFPRINNCNISNNSGFAGIYCHLSDPIIEDCTINNNTQGYGGIFCSSSSPIIANCLIIDNSASLLYSGGAISCYDSSPIIMNCTISNNSSTIIGGGFYCDDNSHPILTNSILWDNSHQEVYFDSGINSLTISHSVLKGGNIGIATNNNETVNWLSGNIDTDPLFVDAANGDFRLSDKSPCISSGILTNAPGKDIEGNLRPIPEDSNPDMGAYENTRGIILSTINDGQKGYYPLNGDAKDASGNGNDGTVNGAILTTGVNGTSNSAYVFDGIDDSILLPAIDESLKGLSRVSVSAWVKNDGTEQVFLCQHKHNRGVLLALDDAGNIIVGVKTTSSPSSGSDWSQCSGSSNTPQGEWVNIILTWDGDVLKGYANASQICSANIDGTFSSDDMVANEELYLGYDSFNDTYFTGTIDEPRIYNRALSESAIQRLAGLIHVDKSYTEEESTGEPETPYKTIAQAIANAVPGSEIRVAQGRYNETLTISDIAGLSLSNGETRGVKIEGGWKNDNGIWTRKSDDLIDPNLTEVRSSGTPGVSIANSPNVIIKGFSLTNGILAMNADQLEFAYNFVVGKVPMRIQESLDVSISNNRLFGVGENNNTGLGVVVEDAIVDVTENFIHSEENGIYYKGTSGASIVTAGVIESNSLFLNNIEAIEALKNIVLPLSEEKLNAAKINIPVSAIKLETAEEKKIEIKNNVLFLQVEAGVDCPPPPPKPDDPPPPAPDPNAPPPLPRIPLRDAISILEIGSTSAPALLSKNQFYGDEDLIFYRDGNPAEDILSDTPGKLNDGTVCDPSGENFYHRLECYKRCTCEETPAVGEPCCVELIEIPTPSGVDRDGDGMPDDWEWRFSELPHCNDTPHDGEEDTDEDGLPDKMEYYYNTNPLNWDTDNDGMRDGWEVQYGLNPLNRKDYLEDPDNDSFTNLSEHNADTIPTSGTSVPELEAKEGVFVVGDTGIVTINVLGIGGAYESEIAIFSLKGMKEFLKSKQQEQGYPNLMKAFLEEALRRAMSNTTEGYIVFSDRTEGAQFGGVFMGEEEDYNKGLYKGIKHFTMNSGEEFCVMLVPDRTLEKLSENLDIVDTDPTARPFFSFSSPNSDYGVHVSRISDINGLGVAFVFEDQDLVSGDQDFNDFIFQVGEVKGNSPIFNSLLDKKVGKVPTIPEKDRLEKFSDGLGKQISDHLDAQNTDDQAIWMSVTTDCPADLLVYDSQGNLIGKEGGYIPGAIYKKNDDGSQTVSWLMGFKLSKTSLDRIQAEIPETDSQVVLKLEGIKDQEYITDDEEMGEIKFIKAIKALGITLTGEEKSLLAKHGKQFILTEESLTKLEENDGIPDDEITELIIKLRNICNRVYYASETKFEDDLKKEIGEEKTEQYKTLIEEYAETKYRLVHQSLEGVETDGLAKEITLKLKGIKNQTFTDEATFIADLNALIGEDNTANYKDVILKHVVRKHFISAKALEQLEADGLSMEIRKELEKLTDSYMSEGEFISALDALEIFIGEEDKTLILQYAKDGNYRIVLQSKEDLNCNVTVSQFKGEEVIFTQPEPPEPFQIQKQEGCPIQVIKSDLLLSPYDSDITPNKVPVVESPAITTASDESFLCYDFDADGDVDIADIMKVASKWGSCSLESHPDCRDYQTFDPFYDLDNDNRITYPDIRQVMKEIWKSGLK